MNSKLLKTSSYVVLATILALSLAQAFSSGRTAAQSQSQAGKLEGTWQADVTVRNCATGVPIRTVQSLNTYIHGGSTLETSSATFFRSPGHGTWQHVGEQNFTTTFTVFRFNDNLNPNPFAFAGTQRITKTIQVGEGGDEYTAITAFEIFDVNGNLVGTGCATDVAHRHE